MDAARSAKGNDKDVGTIGAVEVRIQGWPIRSLPTPRLERWIRRVQRASKLVRALAVLVDDLTFLIGRTRRLVVAIALLALTVVASISLL